MEVRERRPGSVRLTDEQYEEMELLGIANESEYVRHKLNHSIDGNPVNVEKGEVDFYEVRASDEGIQDKLDLQRVYMENAHLKEKLNEIQNKQHDTLQGVQTELGKLLAEELLKRDFEQLRKDGLKQEKEIIRLEQELSRSDNKLQEKDQQLDELMKKIGLIELGKSLLPGAISGLAKRYPRQLQGLADTLGELSGQLPEHPPLNDPALELGSYVYDLFDDDHIESLIQVLNHISELLKKDEQTFRKLHYYLENLSKVKAAQSNAEQNQQLNNDQNE